MKQDALWLSVEEEQAWRRLQLMHLQLTATLSHELAQTAGLSYPDYVVLAVLTGAPEARMRVTELGRTIGWEKSRVSHHISRMVERGYVTRERCQTDQRGAFVVVTKRGHKAIEAAAPGHVAGVRRHFVDLLTPEQLATIREVADAVLEHLAATCDEGADD
jgi:DNA-binding MarR family transcriptional regulator